MCNIKVDIIGSCVTRDAFEFSKTLTLNNKFFINNYISKTSIVSLTSTALQENDYEISYRNMTPWEKDKFNMI